MKKYPVAVLRERLAEALDAAYYGEPVVIERKGVRYFLTRETRATSRAASPRKPMFAAVDPAVMAGEWTWNWSPAGVTFDGRSSHATSATRATRARKK